MIPNTTKTYLQNGATSGSRNQSLFDAACQMRDAGHSQQDVQMMLVQRAIADGLDISEANKTLLSVFSREPREEPTSSRTTKKFGLLRNKKPVAYKTAPKGEYKLTKSRLPEPIPNGDVSLLKIAFKEGENIRIVPTDVDENDNATGPARKGTTKSREWWLDKINERGDLNHIGGGRGLFVGVNPMQPLGYKDEHCSDFRLGLAEFDNLPIEEQWTLIKESKLPCVAVIFSGKKSLHCWVKVDAKDRAEYGQRMKILYDHLADYVDGNNKNPSRLSRLPNCKRGGIGEQQLLAVNIGCESWSDWENHIKAETVGEVFDLRRLATMDTSEDPHSVLGDRWLCKGGSCLFVGQSGIGKSSFVMQLAINWTLGRPTFGITPVRPLSCLVIQAENDAGDVAEQIQGAMSGLNLNVDDDAFAALEQRLTIINDSVNTGEQFTESLRVLVGKHRPDIVFIDPLLSFVGGDISNQETCSIFLRNLLNPISKESGVIWFCAHHTPKPAADPKSKSHWGATDFSYAGTGSSELTNWARSVMLLRATKEEGQFQLHLAKRGKRAGAINFEGDRTRVLHLQHSEEGVLWEQIPTPEEKKQQLKPKAKKTKAAPKAKLTKEELSEIRKAAGTKEIKDLDKLISRIDKPMTKGEIYLLGEANDHGTEYLLRKNWSQIEAKLLKTKNRYLPKPTD